MKFDKYWQYFKNIINYKTNYELVGLDINAEAIKLMQINAKNNHDFEITNFAISNLPPGIVVNDQIKDPVLLSNKLKNLFKQMHTSTNHVAIAIPRSFAIIKNIKVNAKLTLDEIEARVWIEAEHHFANLIGEIYLDFVVTEITDDKNNVEIIFVASRKDQIEPYLNVIRMAGLDTALVDINCYALERAICRIVPSLLQTKTIALLNIDYSLISLLVLENNSLIYANDQTHETHDEKTLTDENHVNKLIAYVRHMLQFFYSGKPTVTINQIIFSGDYALFPELKDRIEKGIGIEVMIVDPIKNMRHRTEVNFEKASKYGPSLMLCCGLALSEFK